MCIRDRDGDLRRVEHRRKALDAKRAEIRHRKSAAVQLVGRDLAADARRGQPLGFAGKLAQAEHISAAHDRNHQPLGRIDRHAQVCLLYTSRCV